MQSSSSGELRAYSPSNTLALPDGFEVPDFTRPLDVEATRALVPEGATARGLFIENLRQLAVDAGHEHVGEGKKYYAFKSYPLTEMMTLAVEVASLLFPNETLREGLRRLGHQVYPTFYASRLGKFVYGMLGNNLRKIFKNAGYGYTASVSHGTCEVVEIADDGCRMVLENVYNFLDCYHVGIMEGAFIVYETPGLVGIKVIDATHAEFAIRWVNE